MLPINIYTLTRVRTPRLMHKVERQMSKRSYFLGIRQWEIDGIKKLADHIYDEMKDLSGMEFYYSFQIPKLGKEFDLLRVSDDQVINIELKSEHVSDERIRKQLELNRVYLALLGRSMRTYTYISGEDRLVRLTNSGRLVESTFAELSEDLARPGELYNGNLEELFAEEKYLISPLTDPDRFLRREYFLTSQQRDIKGRILKKLGEKSYSLQGFTGLPGTGKTLLLYDLAMELTEEKDRVCVLHFGSFPDEMGTLNERLKRIDFYSCRDDREFPDMDGYRAIFVDEGHRMTKEQLKRLVRMAKKQGRPVVFSYDREVSIAPSQRILSRVEDIVKLRGFIEYTLTNRIRMNVELSSFIGFLMKPDMQKRRKEYPNIFVSYAGSRKETGIYLADYKDKGFIYIRGDERDADPQNRSAEIEAYLATCKEFDRIVMVIDRTFSYDEDGYLVDNKTVSQTTGSEAAGIKNDNRSKAAADAEAAAEDSRVRMLFHGLSRAKAQIALIIERNVPVFETVMAGLQGPDGEENAKQKRQKSTT